jgi:hypothetical protein
MKTKEAIRILVKKSCLEDSHFKTEKKLGRWTEMEINVLYVGLPTIWIVCGLF